MKELLATHSTVGNDRPRVRQEVVIETDGKDFDDVVTCLRKYLKEYGIAYSHLPDSDSEHGLAPEDGDMVVSNGSNKIRITSSGLKELQSNGLNLIELINKASGFSRT